MKKVTIHDLTPLLERSLGRLVRIDYSRDAPPVILQAPVSQTTSAGQPVTFTVVASGAPPLAYQWFRNDAPIAGATGASFTLASAAAADNGARFTVRVLNAHAQAMSTAVTLSVVTVTNTPRARSRTSVSTG